MKRLLLLSILRTRLLTAALFAIALFLSWALDANAQASGLLDTNAYVNSPPEFEIHFPKNWQKISSDDASIEFINPAPDEYASVSVDILPNQVLPLKQFADKAYADLKSATASGELQLIKYEEVSLNGEDAYTIEYTVNSNGISLHGYYLILTKNGKGYSVNVSSKASLWDGDKDLLNASTSTFRFRT